MARRPTRRKNGKRRPKKRFGYALSIPTGYSFGKKKKSTKGKLTYRKKKSTKGKLTYRKKKSTKGKRTYKKKKWSFGLAPSFGKRTRKPKSRRTKRTKRRY